MSDVIISNDPPETDDGDVITIIIDDDAWVQQYSLDLFGDQAIDFAVDFGIDIDYGLRPIKTQEELDIDAYNRAMSIL